MGNRSFYSNEDDLRKSIVDLVSKFIIGGRAYLGVRDEVFDPGGERRAPSMIIWVREGKESASGVTGPDPDRSTILQEAVVLGLDRKGQDERETFVREFVLPFVAYGERQFRYEKWKGQIGPAADPLVWQSGFEYDNQPSGGVSKLIVGYDEEKDAFNTLGSGDNTGYISLKELIVSKLKWINHSYASIFKGRGLGRQWNFE